MKLPRSLARIALAAVLILAGSQFAHGQACGETWRKADGPHIIAGPVTIPGGQTVCVEPGVQVQFGDGGQIDLQGSIVGTGTANDRIQFTSVNASNNILVHGTLDLRFTDLQVPVSLNTGTLLLQNCAVGMRGLIGGGFASFVSLENVIFDSNEPVQSFNASIFASGLTAVLKNVTFRNRAFFMVANSFFYVENVVSENSAYDGLSFGGNFLQPIYLSNISVTNSVGAGLVLESGNFELANNVLLQNTENPVKGNGGLLPGSQVPATGNRNNWINATAGIADTTYAPVAVPYVMGGFTGGANFLPGIHIKLRPNGAFSTFNGTLRALGLPEAPITIEQFIPGQKWKSGQFNSEGDRLEYVTLDGSELGIVSAGGAGATFYIDNSIIRNHDRAIALQEFYSSFLQGNLFTNNGTAIEADDGTQASGQTNPNLFENNARALAVPFGQNPDARSNWWNSATGPTAPDNPGGTGEVIDGFAQFSPFRTARPDTSDHPPVVRIVGAYKKIFEPASKVLLTWNASDDQQIAKQRILFSAAGNARNTFSVIADNLPAGQNSFEFTVPNIGFQGSGSQAFVRVQAIDDQGHEGWDEWQALIVTGDEAGTLQITSPVAGQTFVPPQEVPLTWNVTQPFESGASFEGFLLLEADNKQIPLGGGDANGTFGTPQMPFVSTDSARFAVRVSGSLNRQKWFYSAPFSIRPDARWVDAPPQVSLISPMAGQQFSARGTIMVSWTASDDDALRRFDLQASLDGARTWQTVVENLPATARNYTWQLPQNGAAVADARLRVVAVDRRFQNSSDGQNRVFSILAASPSPTPTPTPTPAPTATPSPTASPIPTPTPAASPSATPTPVPTATPSATPTASPSPSPTATPTASPSPSPTATPMPASQPLNIATRGRVETGDNAMFGGFIITGSAEKKVGIRAIGPSLRASLPGALADPVLELRRADGSLVRRNDNWRDDASQAAEIETNQIAPAHNLESTIVATLAPGNYTATVTGKNGGTGVGLVEVYDLNQSADSKLANISTRGIVQSADDVLIGGFILGGTNANAKVLVRAIGPSLAALGINNSLSDPTLELRDGNGVLLQSNDNWKDQQRTDIETSGLAPATDSEAAIIADLRPGLYTTIVAGKASSGVGLIEIYNLP
jgi:hypothetical protein